MEVQEAFEKLTKGRLVEGYGLTEASPVTHANPLSEKRKVGTIGVPLPSTEAVIVDLARRTKEVKQGQIGELAVRGPQVMLGYWKESRATKEVLTDDGWLLTGDVAARDEEGYYRLVGRLKDLVISGGENVYPAELENVLHEHAAVGEAAVVGVPDERWGEACLAFVVLADGESAREDELLAFCRERLARYKVPREVRFVDALPRNALNKVAKSELLELVR